jgi:XTP/dITP diphosphohydrolase
MRRRILVASTNPGKIAELRAMLGDDVEWVSLSDFKGVEEIIEDGQSFAENARKKAAGYAKATGLWTIADDSGLVVDVLDGAPGVKSARFSETTSGSRLRLGTPYGGAETTPQVSETTSGSRRAETTPQVSGAKDKDRTLLDHKNMAKVLKLLEGVPAEKRTARFVCCLCLASPEELLIETEGTLEGFIAEKEMGESGFGYDPIFFVPQLGKTVAQLSREEKNAISHRGGATRKLKPLLEQLLRTR